MQHKSLALSAIAMGLNVGTEEGSYDDLKWWNPGAYTQQAYELAEVLNITYTTFPTYSEAKVAGTDILYVAWTEDGQDPLIATRRAIVNAATFFLTSQ